jgi:hypothetical protein
MTLFLGHAVAYYSLAVLGFSFLVDNYSIIDSLYLASVTFTTIGYGDVHPKDAVGRIYLIFLATYGIVILGVFLGVLVSVSERRDCQRSVTRFVCFTLIEHTATSKLR